MLTAPLTVLNIRCPSVLTATFIVLNIRRPSMVYGKTTDVHLMFKMKKRPVNINY
jgi:hypothetical protein